MSGMTLNKQGQWKGWCPQISFRIQHSARTQMAFNKWKVRVVRVMAMVYSCSTSVYLDLFCYVSQLFVPVTHTWDKSTYKKVTFIWEHAVHSWWPPGFGPVMALHERHSQGRCAPHGCKKREEEICILWPPLRTHPCDPWHLTKPHLLKSPPPSCTNLRAKTLEDIADPSNSVPWSGRQWEALWVWNWAGKVICLL